MLLDAKHSKPCIRNQNSKVVDCSVSKATISSVESSSGLHGTRRGSLARWEHHMHWVAKWLAASHAEGSRRVIWKITSSCTLNRVVLDETLGGLRANMRGMGLKRKQLQGSTKHAIIRDPYLLLCGHLEQCCKHISYTSSNIGQLFVQYQHGMITSSLTPVSTHSISIVVVARGSHSYTRRSIFVLARTCGPSGHSLTTAAEHLSCSLAHRVSGGMECFRYFQLFIYRMHWMIQFLHLDGANFEQLSSQRFDILALTTAPSPRRRVYLCSFTSAKAASRNSIST